MGPLRMVAPSQALSPSAGDVGSARQPGTTGTKQLICASQPAGCPEPSLQKAKVRQPDGSLEVNGPGRFAFRSPHQPPAPKGEDPEPTPFALANNGDEVDGPLYTYNLS